MKGIVVDVLQVLRLLTHGLFFVAVVVLLLLKILYICLEWNMHPEFNFLLVELISRSSGGCGCPIPGGIQDWVGCDSGQPGLGVGSSAYSRGFETR